MAAGSSVWGRQKNQREGEREREREEEFDKKRNLK